MSSAIRCARRSTGLPTWTPWWLALLLGAAPAQAQEEEPEDEEVIEVVTTPSPIREGSDPTPAVYRVTGEALERPGARMDDVLERVPGVQTRRRGGAADLASASVRGATSAQTPIYLGGVRLNDDLTGTVDLSTLPLWMLRRVSVFRGAAPIGADELGIGGAIQLEPRLERGVHGRGALGVGSFGEREARGAVSFGDGDSGATLALRHRSSDGDFAFVDDAGTRFDDDDDLVRRRANADHAELDVWTVGRARLDGATLTTFVNGFERRGGAPGLQLVGAERARSAQRRVIGGLSGVVDCGASWGCAVAVDVGVLSTRYRLSDPDRELGGPRRSEQTGQRLTERVRWLFAPVDGVHLGLGGLLEQQRLGLDAGAAQRARRVRLRPETSVVWRVTDEVALAGVGALECHHTEAQLGEPLGEGRTCGVLEPTGRIGGRVRPWRWLSFFGNVGRYLRVPTLGELYGASATVLGNAALVPERAVGVDAGLNAEGRAGPVTLWLQVTGFARWSDDLITYRRSSFSTLRPYNTDRARTVGAEVATGARAWDVIELGAAVTFLDPRDTSPEREVSRDLLPFSARLVAAPHVGIVSPAWGTVALDEAALRLSYLHRSSTVADPAGLVILSEQNLLDLDASLAFAEMVVVRGRVANLIDQRTVDLVGYPLPGRSFHGMVEARF